MAGITPILLLIATAQGAIDIQYNVSTTQFETTQQCDNYVRQHTTFGPKSKSNDGNIYYLERNRAHIGAITIPAGSKVRTTCLDITNIKGSIK